MPREWQQKRYKQFVLPDAVYFQCVWAVRDLYRMEKRIEELERKKKASEWKASAGREPERKDLRRRERDGLYSALRVSDQGIYYGDGFDAREEERSELRALKRRVKLIREALETVPEEYHANILDNIILRTPSKAYPGKMWKYWKQRFLYAVAKKLAMI